MSYDTRKARTTDRQDCTDTTHNDSCTDTDSCLQLYRLSVVSVIRVSTRPSTRNQRKRSCIAHRTPPHTQIYTRPAPLPVPVRFRWCQLVPVPVPVAVPVAVQYRCRYRWSLHDDESRREMPGHWHCALCKPNRRRTRRLSWMHTHSTLKTASARELQYRYNRVQITEMY